MGNLRGSSPQRFYEGSLASAEILLNLIAVTILANPETLDVAKKEQHSYIVSLLYSKIICIHMQL